MKTSLVLSLVFLFSITASLLSAQQKTTSIIRDASGTVKYLSQYEGQTYLLELHEDDDLSVYRYNLTQGAQHWYSINIPGLWSASNLVISDRSLLFSKSDKLVYFDFVNGDFKMNGTTATGNFKAPGKLAIPAQLSFFVQAANHSKINQADGPISINKNISRMEITVKKAIDKNHFHIKANDRTNEVSPGNLQLIEAAFFTERSSFKCFHGEDALATKRMIDLGDNNFFLLTKIFLKPTNIIRLDDKMSFKP